MTWSMKQKSIIQNENIYCKVWIYSKKPNHPGYMNTKSLFTGFNRKIEMGCLIFSKLPSPSAFIAPVSCHSNSHICSCYLTAQDHIFPSFLAQYFTWAGIALSSRKTYFTQAKLMLSILISKIHFESLPSASISDFYQYYMYEHN